jgi:hypothetical protein
MIPLLVLASLPNTQLSIPRVDLLPDRPRPYALRDWAATARTYDRVVFDEGATGTYLPLVWRVLGAPNLDRPGFGLPSYVGKEEMRGKTGEGIAAMGSLLGATAVGIDKREWVELTPQFLNPQEGTVLNNAGGKSGSTFWYELLPSVVFTQLASRYPEWSRGQSISRGIAEAWRGAIDVLGANFDHTSYDFARRKPVDNGQWKEPDASAAVAYLQLFDALRSGKAKPLAAARRALGAMQRREDNPTYEILTAFGVQAAAYLNAERGDRWDVPRFVDWCFDPTSPNRVGWGMVAGRWGDYDVGGLMGSTNDGGGYAFAMNTFLNLATLLPVARYDDRFSAALAKWTLNATNASRLFYKDALPPSHQSGRAWPGDPKAGIAYEALRKTWEGNSPYAAGDAKRNGWAKEDFGLYGGSYVGLLAALVHPTNVPEILRIDLRATDYLPVKAYPTELFWNPYDVPKTVLLKLDGVRPYDAVSNRFLSLKAVRGAYRLNLAPKQAIQVVQVPAKGSIAYARNRTVCGVVTIDANNGRVPLPPRVRRVRRDESVAVGVPKAVNGRVDWSKATPTLLAGGNGGRMRAELRFGWDESSLYFAFRQTAPGTENTEAPDRAELRKHRWDFDHFELSLDPSRETFPLTAVPEVMVGLSSTGRKDLIYSDDLPDRAFAVSTTGTAARADRKVTGRIAWADLYRALGTREPLRTIVRRGSRIACQPLMVDGSFRHQSYLNGKGFIRPTGFDRDSRTLVLR